MKSPKGIERYMSRILYDATLELWMKKQFLNGSVNWDTLNALLSKDVKRSFINTHENSKNWANLGSNKGETFDNRLNLENANNTLDSEFKNFTGADERGDGDASIERKVNEFYSGGNANDVQGKTELEANTTNEGKQYNKTENVGDNYESDILAHEFTENSQQVKFDYLDKVYSLINENKFIFERYFGDFLFSLTMMNQNPEVDEFPWP